MSSAQYLRSGPGAQPAERSTGAVQALAPQPAERGAGGSAFLAALRPRQWPKNILVFAAPVASGALAHPANLLRVLVALIVFVAASSATYLVNDVADQEADRLHPVKRHRPVASGRLDARLALVAAAMLGLGAASAAALVGPALALVVGAYMAISAAYTFRLKRVAVVELACVASGFTLRAVGGAVAGGARSSPWFLVMVSFGALFVVAGKRRSEQMALGDSKEAHRRSLGDYPPEFLRSLRVLAMSVTVTMYCLWAFQRAGELALGKGSHLLWFELSIVPFVMAVLLVELAVQNGRGGEPEELALTDHALQLCGIVWVILVSIGIYA